MASGWQTSSGTTGGKWLGASSSGKGWQTKAPPYESMSELDKISAYLEAAGIEEPKPKPNILERIIYGLGATEWTDEAMRAAKGEITSVPQFIGEYLWDIPKTLIGALSPGLTKEDVYEPKGTEFAKELGLKGKGATLAGLAMDILEPSLLIGTVTGGGETILAKGGKGLLKMFGKEGVEGVSKKLVKEGAEAVEKRLAKELAWESSRQVARGAGKELSKALQKDVLTRVLKSDEAIKAGYSVFKKPGLYADVPFTGISKRVGSLGPIGDIGVGTFVNPLGTAVMGAKKVAGPVVKGIKSALGDVAGDVAPRVGWLMQDAARFDTFEDFADDYGKKVYFHAGPEDLKVTGEIYLSEPTTLGRDYSEAYLSKAGSEKLYHMEIAPNAKIFDLRNPAHAKMLQDAIPVEDYQKIVSSTDSGLPYWRLFGKDATELKDIVKQLGFDGVQLVERKVGEVIPKKVGKAIKADRELLSTLLFDRKFVAEALDDSQLKNVFNASKKAALGAVEDVARKEPGVLEKAGAVIGETVKPFRDTFQRAFSTAYPWKQAGALPLRGIYSQFSGLSNEAKVLGGLQGKVYTPVIKDAMKKGMTGLDFYKAVEFKGGMSGSSIVRKMQKRVGRDIVWKKGFEDVGAIIDQILEANDEVKGMREMLGLKNVPAHISRRAKKVLGLSKKVQTEAQRAYGAIGEGVRAAEGGKFKYDLSEKGIVDSLVRDYVSNARVRAKYGFMTDLINTPTVSKAFNKAGLSEEELATGAYKQILGRNGKVIPMLEEYVFPSEIADILNKNLNAFNSYESMNPFWKSMHGINSVFKLAVTSLAVPIPGTRIRIPISPAFFGRNFFNNMATMVLYGGFKNPIRVSEAKTVMDYVGELTRNGLEAANKKFAKKMIHDVDVPSLFQEMLKRNLISVGEIASYAEEATGIAKKVAPYVSASNVGTWIEDLSKTSLFLDGIAKGKTFDESSDLVKKLLFDYTDLTEFERKYMKEIFPFYTWTKKNLELQLGTMITDPRRMAVISDLYEAGRDLFTDMRPEDRAKLPEWMQNSLGIAFGSIDDKVDVMLTTGTSLEALTNVFGTDPQSTLLNLINMSTPLARIPTELAFGVSSFKKAPIEEDIWASRFKDYPESVKKLLGVIEIERVDKKTGKKYTDYRINPYTKYWAQNIFGPEMATASRLSAFKELGLAKGTANFLLGMKTYSMDMEDRQRQYEREQQEAMQRELMRKTGLGNIYESYYLPTEQQQYLGIE